MGAPWQPGVVDSCAQWANGFVGLPTDNRDLDGAQGLSLMHSFQAPEIVLAPKLQSHAKFGEGDRAKAKHPAHEQELDDDRARHERPHEQPRHRERGIGKAA